MTPPQCFKWCVSFNCTTCGAPMPIDGEFRVACAMCRTEGLQHIHVRCELCSPPGAFQAATVSLARMSR